MLGYQLIAFEAHNVCVWTCFTTTILHQCISPGDHGILSLFIWVHGCMWMGTCHATLCHTSMYYYCQSKQKKNTFHAQLIVLIWESFKLDSGALH